MRKLALHWQILIALALAVFFGLALGQTPVLGVSPPDVYDFFGTLFLNALKMLIVPLIVSSMICGVAGVGDGESMGRLGGKTVIYYLCTSLLAILTGLLLVNWIQPGLIDGQPARDVIGLSAETQTVLQKVEGRGSGDLVAVFLRIVPPNVVSAAVEGQMLGLIFFSILFGTFMTRLPKKQKDALTAFWQGVFEVMMRMTDWVMLFAPIGVFGLVAKVVAQTGLAAFAPLMSFFFTVVLALAIHTFLTLPLLIQLIARRSALRHFLAMSPAMLTAFSTSSSSATLPVTMDCLEKRAKVSNRVTSFVLPLGATVNMDGTALYECVAALFIAQAYGLGLDVATQFTVVVIALLTSIGVAGIPAASLVAISIILTAVGLPAEGIGLILAVDRILDMCRTSVNVFSDSCGAVLIGRMEGEEDILTDFELGRSQHA